MSRHEIKCIDKSNRTNPNERLEFISGLNGNGTRWRVSQEKAIEGIESGKWEFFIMVNGLEIDIEISIYGHYKILKAKTVVNGLEILLSLPECSY
ncbi:DUF3892 domain-containing protein [Pedobacter sp. G11]|uniref:DUF3892 domain-containing protein n=1 Tax=Pedobacter sp. G11 TaxID=2482728 RepID=UPI001AEF9DD3|nr:DUF3892 domain-containing protein [Pedobacter sp. G11]